MAWLGTIGGSSRITRTTTFGCCRKKRSTLGLNPETSFSFYLMPWKQCTQRLVPSDAGRSIAADSTANERSYISHKLKHSAIHIEFHVRACPDDRAEPTTALVLR